MYECVCVPVYMRREVYLARWKPFSARFIATQSEITQNEVRKKPDHFDLPHEAENKQTDEDRRVFILPTRSYRKWEIETQPNEYFRLGGDFGR